MQQQRTTSDTINFAELRDEIADLARGAWRFRWQAIVVAWLLCLPVWWVVLSMPDIYQASGRLHIVTDGSLRPLLRGLAIQSDLLDDVNVMLKSILSRPTLKKIAQRSGLDLGDLPWAEEDALIKRLRKGIVLELDRSQILKISVEHSNPDVALAVVSVVTDEFVEGLLVSSRSDTKSAQDFLQRKLTEYEVLLSEAEERLANFKKRNIGQMPGERGGYFSRLQGEMRSLELLDSNIKLTRQRRDNLELQMAGETPVFGIMSPSSGAMSSSPQIAQLEAQLTDLRLSYTDSHPDVLRVKELLESLRAEQTGPRSNRRIVATPAADMNPVYQQMKMQFNQADLELSQLLTQRADQKKIVESLKLKIDTIPEIEAELTRLNRAYDVNKRQHGELLTRLEQARLSEDADNSSTSMKFRVIDPPAVGSAPVGPNRPLFLTAALLLALAAGLGLAGARSIVSPVFYSARKLERLFGTPVLGTLKKVRSNDERVRLRMNTALLSAAFLTLIGCYGALIVFDQASVQLAGRLVNMLG